MLELFDLTVRFGKEGSANAVEEISLKIEDREKVFLIGETGSGKSVLLMAILGMLPDSAVITGRAVLDGRDILNLPEKENAQDSRNKNCVYSAGKRWQTREYPGYRNSPAAT